MAPYAISSAKIAMFGEDNTPTPSTDFIDAVNPLYFRSIGRAQKYGFVPVWMNMTGRGGFGGRHAARQVLGWCWQHDIVPEVHTSRRGRHLVELRSKWGIMEDAVRFHPYWTEEAPFETGDPDILVSAWTRPGGHALLQVLNTGRDGETEATIEFDPAALGIEGPHRIVDVETLPEVEQFLAKAAQIDALLAENPNSPAAKDLYGELPLRPDIDFDTGAMQTVGQDGRIEVTVPARDFKTLAVVPVSDR